MPGSTKSISTSPNSSPIEPWHSSISTGTLRPRSCGSSRFWRCFFSPSSPGGSEIAGVRLRGGGGAGSGGRSGRGRSGATRAPAARVCRLDAGRLADRLDGLALAMAAIYYLVVTPIGLIMRLCGRDPMHRRFDRAGAATGGPAPPRPARVVISGSSEACGNDRAERTTTTVVSGSQTRRTRSQLRDAEQHVAAALRDADSRPNQRNSPQRPSNSSPDCWPNSSTSCCTTRSGG